MFRHQVGAASKQAVRTNGKPNLTKVLVNLTKLFPPHHGHLIYDEVLHVCHGLLHLMMTFSLQVLSRVPWDLYWPFAIRMVKLHLSSQLLSRYGSIPTRAPHSPMALFLSLHSAAPGLHLVFHAHVYSSPSNWHGLLLFIRLKAIN